MKSRNRAWRRKQTRKILGKIDEAKNWLLKPLQKRNAEKPAPIAECKPHKRGKLTKIQQLKLLSMLNAELRDEAA
jgi:hypothetical protein